VSRWADPTDAATELEGMEREAAIRAHERARAARSLNETGLCADCGEPIDARRLAIDPAAERCVDCQQTEDLRAKGRR